MRVEHLCHIRLLLLNELPELSHLANLLEGKDLVLLVSIDSKTCRVVPAIFQSGETCIYLAGSPDTTPMAPITINKGVNDEFAVLFHQVGDVAEYTTIVPCKLRQRHPT